MHGKDRYSRHTAQLLEYQTLISHLYILHDARFQKVSFQPAKGYLSHAKSLPFIRRKLTF